jgi:hypothetical protein
MMSCMQEIFRTLLGRDQSKFDARIRKLENLVRLKVIRTPGT